MKQPKKVYASKKADWKRKNAMVKDVFGGWADFRPRRDVGVYANERTTYKHNGETKLI
jgi:hypothetical protein